MIADDPIERWEQLENYLMGRMEAEEVRQLIERMKTDKQLAEELNTVRRAHTLLNEAFVEDQMRASLRQIRAEQDPVSNVFYHRPIGYRAPVWLVAACLLLVGYLSLTPIWLPNAGYDIGAIRGIDTMQLPPRQRIAFANFFDGQARMVEGDYVQAAHHFEEVLTVDDLRPYFKEAAEWHLTVSYLRSRQISRASMLYKRLRQCETCTYEVGWLERRKLEWQLLLAGLIP